MTNQANSSVNVRQNSESGNRRLGRGARSLVRIGPAAADMVTGSHTSTALIYLDRLGLELG